MSYDQNTREMKRDRRRKKYCAKQIIYSPRKKRRKNKQTLRRKQIKGDNRPSIVQLSHATYSMVKGKTATKEEEEILIKENVRNRTDK